MRVVHSLLGYSFAPGSILLLDLLSYLILSADALVVDLLGLLWGQPELGGCRLRVYVRWGCGSRAYGGVRLSRFVLSLLYTFCCLYPFSSILFCGSVVRSLLASPSVTFALPPLGLVLCEPFVCSRMDSSLIAASSSGLIPSWVASCCGRA